MLFGPHVCVCICQAFCVFLHFFVLQVPPQELASRLDAVLQGIADAATPEVALAYTQHHNKLCEL
jgi:hypothetical protein